MKAEIAPVDAIATDTTVAATVKAGIATAAEDATGPATAAVHIPPARTHPRTQGGPDDIPRTHCHSHFRSQRREGYTSGRNSVDTAGGPVNTIAMPVYMTGGTSGGRPGKSADTGT